MTELGLANTATTQFKLVIKRQAVNHSSGLDKTLNFEKKVNNQMQFKIIQNQQDLSASGAPDNDWREFLNSRQTAIHITPNKSRAKRCLKDKCCVHVPKKMIVSYKNKLLTRWETIPMLLSIYDALHIPLDFSFPVGYGFLQINECINIVVDLLFLVDNVLVFFTTFENRLGEEICDHFEIF